MALEGDSTSCDPLAYCRFGTVKVWDAATGRLLGGWAGKTENFQNARLESLRWMARRVEASRRRASA